MKKTRGEWNFSFLTLQLLHTPQNFLDSKALQMIHLSLCDLHNIHSCWCHASQIRISPQKKTVMMKAFSSAQLAGRDDRKGWGRRKRRALPPTPMLLHSLGLLLGVYASCHSPLFLSPLPHSAASPLTSLLSSSLTLSSSLPVLSLSLSQGFNLWLWSSRNRGDNPRFPLLC